MWPYLPFAAIGLINTIGVVVWSISSFGNGIIYHVGFAVCRYIDNDVCSGDLSVVVVHITLATLVLFPSQLMILRNSVNWPLAINLSLSQQIGLYVGMYVLFLVESVWLGRVMGLLFFLVALHIAITDGSVGSSGSSSISNGTAVHSLPISSTHKLSNDDHSLLSGSDGSSSSSGEIHNVRSSSDSSSSSTGGSNIPHMSETADMPEMIPVPQPDDDDDELQPPHVLDSWRKYGLVWLTGLASGLFSGLFATGGPPLMLFVAYTHLQRKECRATVAFCDMCNNTGRIIFLLFFQSKIDLWSRPYLLTFGVLSGTSLLSLLVGNELAKFTNQAIFRKMLVVLLSAGSVFISILGCTWQQSVVVAVCGLFVMVLAMSVSFVSCSKMVAVMTAAVTTAITAATAATAAAMDTVGSIARFRGKGTHPPTHTHPSASTIHLTPTTNTEEPTSTITYPHSHPHSHTTSNNSGGVYSPVSYITSPKTGNPTKRGAGDDDEEQEDVLTSFLGEDVTSSGGGGHSSGDGGLYGWWGGWFSSHGGSGSGTGTGTGTGAGAGAGRGSGSGKSAGNKNNPYGNNKRYLVVDSTDLDEDLFENVLF